MGSLCVDDVRVTKDSTVAGVNEMRDGEKFVDELGAGFYGSAEYGRKSVGLIVNQQQFITGVIVDSGLVKADVKVK